MALDVELNLVDVVDEIADVVEPAVLPQLRRFFARSTLAVDTGPWKPEVMAAYRNAFGLVVLDAVLVGEIVMGGRRCTELLLPGDVVAPWTEPATMLPLEATWHVAQAGHVAVLDRTFLAAATRWPGLVSCLAGRYGETHSRLAVHKSICQMPRVEDRVSLLLWHVAERIGHVTPEATTVPLALTHAELGHLVGAQRSTVTLALAELERQGALLRDADGTFALLGEAPAAARPPRRRPRRQAAGAAVATLPPTADRQGGLASPEFAALRERVHELGERYVATAERVLNELERSRVTRERSAALRERVMRQRERTREAS